MYRFVASSPLHGYFIAALAVAATLICRLFFLQFNQIGPFLLFALPVLFSAWFFGRGAGFLATGLSATAIQYLVLSPIKKPVDWISIILFTTEGILISVFAAAKKHEKDLEHDIIERTKELETVNKRLQSAQVVASLGTAVAKIIHEIAQPLNALFTSLQLHERYLKNRKENLDEETTQFMEDTKEELLRLQGFLNELREFSRPFTLNLSPLNVAATVTNGIEMEKLLKLNLKRIIIEHQFAEDLPPVMADSEKLRSVLVNLCKNAIEAMPDGGKLILRGYRSEKNVCLEIEDHGVGVPPGVNIFEPFTTSKRTGWGLGLSIVRQIVSAHKGTIEYKSDQGRGTVFKICLPAAS